MINNIKFHKIKPSEKTKQFNDKKILKTYYNRKKICIKKAKDFLILINQPIWLKSSLKKRDEFGDCLCQFMAFLKINKLFISTINNKREGEKLIFYHLFNENN